MDFFRGNGGMGAPKTPVMHCGAENLAARLQLPASAGMSWVEIFGNSELTSIATIKLRSPPFAGPARGGPAKARRARLFGLTDFARGRGKIPLRAIIILGFRGNDPWPGDGSKATGVVAEIVRKFAGDFCEKSIHLNIARDGAGGARLMPLTGNGRARRNGCSSASATPPRMAPGTQKFMASRAKPARSVQIKPALAIAPSARRFNVGLTVNRDDHVTKVPVVVRRHAQSGE